MPALGYNYFDLGNNRTASTSPFVSASSTQLNSCAPAINAGTNSATALAWVTTDLAGNPRFYNGGVVDMGAYEFQSAPFSVSLTANPSLTINQGASTTLTASGASSYTWSTGVSSTSIVAAPSTTRSYSTTGASAAGCTKVASVTVVVIPKPDLTPILYARPGLVNDTTNISLVVDVVELNSVTTSGLITVRITKDALISLPSGATTIGDWTQQPDAGGYYVFTTSYQIPAGDKLSLSLSGVLTPGASTGNLTVSATVEGGSEVKLNNNIDADKIDYFQQ